MNKEYRIESTMLASSDQLATGSEDGFLHIYDVVSGQVLAQLDHNPTKYVHSISAHPTKNHLLLSNAGHHVYVWVTSSEDVEMDTK